MERLPGFRDFYPEPVPHADLSSADARQYIFDQWRATAKKYGFREYDGPPLEPLELFTTKSGDEILGQLYNFKDKGDREMSLRPEMTPTLARMAAAHERNYKKPFKWFAIPQLFRYERPQKGRLREHFQFNADILGESDVSADAELIALLIDTLRSFGLTQEDFVIRLSSREAWHDYFVRNNGEASRELEFYQVVDKLERDEPEVSAEKLKALGFSLDSVKAFVKAGEPSEPLRKIIQDLEARGLAGYVRVDYGVIRGLAYYTGTVFEAFALKENLRAIAGGGRYDNLIKLISGGKVQMPALGFGMGDVVLLELIKARNLLPSFEGSIGVYCIIEELALRNESLKLISELRAGGATVDYSLGQVKADKQFKRAQELKVAQTVKLEKTDSGKLEARVRNMRTREEQRLSVDEAKSLLTANRERKG